MFVLSSPTSYYRHGGSLNNLVLCSPGVLQGHFLFLVPIKAASISTVEFSIEKIACVLGALKQSHAVPGLMSSLIWSF